MLRGGVGAFAARPPYAWLTNAYNGSGMEQTSLTCTSDDGVPLPTTDLTRLPTQCLRRSGQVPLPRVNYFDPGVRFPRAVKLVLGVDREMGRGLTASLDLSHTRTRDHLLLDDVNLTDQGTNAEGRAMYGLVTGTGAGRAARRSDGVGGVYRFSNRSADRSSAVTAMLARRWSGGGSIQAGYMWWRAPRT